MPIGRLGRPCRECAAGGGHSTIGVGGATHQDLRDLLLGRRIDDRESAGVLRRRDEGAIDVVLQGLHNLTPDGGRPDTGTRRALAHFA